MGMAEAYFTGLGCGARLLRPILVNPKVRLFEACIAALRRFIAVKILLG
jgi:arginine exporter protein ArgO